MVLGLFFLIFVHHQFIIELSLLLPSFEADAVIVASILRNRKWAVADESVLTNPLNVRLNDEVIEQGLIL